MNKKTLTETDVRTKFITPAIVGANGEKWNVMTQIREEVYFTKGRVIVRGKTVKRGESKKADYILSYKPNLPLAVVEAKDNTFSVGAGMQQALEYAETLDLPFAYSSNGDAFLELDPDDPIILAPARMEYLRQRREAALRADREDGQSREEILAYRLFEEWQRGYLAQKKAAATKSAETEKRASEKSASEEADPKLHFLHPRHPAPVLESSIAADPELFAPYGPKPASTPPPNPKDGAVPPSSEPAPGQEDSAGSPASPAPAPEQSGKGHPSAAAAVLPVIPTVPAAASV